MATTIAEFNVGSKILAKDKKERSCAAVVTKVRSAGAGRELHIHFVGFKKSEDEWIDEMSERLSIYVEPEPETLPAAWFEQGHIEDDAWLVDNIQKKRRVRGKYEYLIKWQGWGNEHNSWESRANIDPELITQFNGPMAPPPKAKRPGGAARRPVPRPFVVIVCETLTSEFKVEMANLVRDYFVSNISRAIFSTLKHSSMEWHNKLVLRTWIAPAMFAALHDLFVLWVAELQLPGDADLFVTPIKSVRGGTGGILVQDSFTVNSHKLLAKIAGGEPIFERNPNLSLLYLVPELKFTYETTQQATPAKSDLIVTGQVIKLTLDTNDDSRAVFGFDRKRGRKKNDPKDVNYSLEFELAQKVALCRRVLAMADALPPTSDPTHALPLPARLRAFCDGVLSAFAVSQAAS